MRSRVLVGVGLGTLGLCAWLHARGVSALTGAALYVPDVGGLREPHGAPAIERVKSADAILARNPFDSVTGPLIPAAAGSGEGASEGVGELPACAGVRVASIVAAAEPGASFVLLEREGEREPMLRGTGGDVAAIRADRVLLEHEGKPCVARMFAPRPAAAPASSASASSATPALPAAARGIARLGPGAYAVDRAARDALLEGAADLMRTVSVAPEKSGDRLVGLRVTALKPGTPLEALGLRAGDVIVAAGGVDLSSPDQMVQALARLRFQEHVRVELLRGGRPLQVDYEVR